MRTCCIVVGMHCQYTIKLYQGPFLLTWIIFNLSVGRKYSHYRVWYENTYPISNFNDSTVEVWKQISNFFPQFFPVWLLTQLGLTFIHVSKRALGNFTGPHNIWDVFTCDDKLCLFDFILLLDIHRNIHYKPVAYATMCCKINNQ